MKVIVIDHDGTCFALCPMLGKCNWHKDSVAKCTCPANNKRLVPVLIKQVWAMFCCLHYSCQQYTVWLRLNNIVQCCWQLSAGLFQWFSFSTLWYILYVRPICCYSQLGTSPLHLAAQYGHTTTAEVLLRAGVSRDARTKVIYFMFIF